MATIDIPAAPVASGVGAAGPNCRCLLDPGHHMTVAVGVSSVVVTSPELADLAPEEHDRVVAYLEDYLDAAVSLARGI